MNKLNLFFILIAVSLVTFNSCDYKQKQKEEERKKKEEQEYAIRLKEFARVKKDLNNLLKQAVNITAYRVRETHALIATDYIKFQIINNTTKDLRYIEWETTFYNDFGDYIGENRFSYEANNKADVLKSGYQVELTWALSIFAENLLYDIYKHSDTYTTKIDKIRIRLADNNKYIEYIDYEAGISRQLDVLYASESAINDIKKEISLLKSILK